MSVIKRRRVYRWMWARRSRSRWRSRVAPESLFTVGFGAGEPLRRPGPRLVRTAAAPEEIMTCRCSAARAKLLFSFLFLYDYAAMLPRRPTTLLRTAFPEEPVGVSSLLSVCSFGQRQVCLLPLKLCSSHVLPTSRSFFSVPHSSGAAPHD